VPGRDQQTLLQSRGVRDHHVEITVRCGAQDLSRGCDDGREARAGPERLEHGEHAGLLDSVGGAEAKGRSAGLTSGQEHTDDDEASHAGISRSSGRKGKGETHRRAAENS